MPTATSSLRACKERGEIGSISSHDTLISIKKLYNTPDGAVAELADAADLKSAGGDTMWVRPPPALQIWLNRGKTG